MRRHTGEIFGAFLRLGLSSFGGPVAHLEYFRKEFVERRRWLDAAQYAQLLAIAQFLPGPASSQLGLGIGLLRGGARGALAAFTAFTLPSALLMYLLATRTAALAGANASVAVHALKLVAAAVVLDGVLRMAKALTPDSARLTLGIVAALFVILTDSAWSQLVAIAAAALAGAAFLRPTQAPATTPLEIRVSRRAQGLMLALVAISLLGALAWTRRDASLASLAAAMWRAGSLVFGGGHVVLPLLEESTVASGWLDGETFLAGYGAAQLVPGPMFSLAAYLGALTPTGVAPWLSALVAVLAIFTPGFLLLAALLPVWDRVTAHPTAARAVAGVNAAVVGLLAAALVDSVLPAALVSGSHVLILAVAFAAQRLLRRPTLAVLAICALGALWSS